MATKRHHQNVATEFCGDQMMVTNRRHEISYSELKVAIEFRGDINRRYGIPGDAFQ